MSKMFRNFLFSLIIFLSMCNNFNYKRDINQPSWLKRLVSYVKEDTSIHQTLLIINEDLFKNDQTEKIIQEIKHIKLSMHFVVRKDSIEKEISNLKQLKAFAFPTTTFFIIIDSAKNNLSITKEIIMMISILLKGRFRPKCLLLQFSDVQESFDPMKKKLLRTAWDNQFLDVSILEIFGNTSKVRYFNPFMKTYSTQKYRSRTALFPDKLRNMNRYEFKVAIFHYPPHVYIKYKSGYPVNYSGSDILLLNAFAKKMNFVVKFESKFSLNSPLVMEQLLLNKIQIGLFRAPLTKIGKYSYLEHLVTGVGCINALIPKIQEQEDSSLNFLLAITPLAVFSAILWMLIYLLKLFSKDWNLSNTMQIILSLTVPEQPEDLKTRIIFAYMVIVSFIYSSNIYGMITSINLKSATELQLMTLAELDKSGLNIEINPVLIDWMNRNVQNLSIVRNSKFQFSTAENCVEHAIEEKNVGCVMLKTDANWYNSRFKGEDGRTLTTTTEEPFIISLEGFYLEPGSPYIKRINSHLLRLMAFGLFEKWSKDVSPKTSADDRSEDALDDLSISYNTLFLVLVTELLMGYLISCVVFVVEIVAVKIKKARSSSN